ncbi:uroporphyrinogen-III C-methyltransferase [Pseudobowmanella zhangzhouensis]|uniref:Uroporphyrinogen-III C-methyltransferase n=1 Tax=Pseudobowmanella zhangzhouensis TaxID=1537679 RepID=A0ABW1XPP9_9ALTE
MTHFLLLRPQPKLTASVAALQQAGLAVTGLAVQQVENDVSEAARLQAELAKNPPDGWVVTSTYAAQNLITALAEQLPRDGRFYAVGEASATVLRDAGLSVTVPKRHDSEGLLELAELIDVKDKRLWLIKGHGGRDLLAATLTERGAQPESFNLYKRVDLDISADIKALIATPPDAIIATSNEQLALFCEALSEDWLQARHWCVAGQRQADYLHSKGITQIALCDGASDQALIAGALKIAEQQAMAEQQAKDAEQQNALTELEQNLSFADREQPAAPVKSAKWPGVLALLNLLLLAGVIAAAVWFYLNWQQWQAQQNETQQQALWAQVEQQRQELQTLTAGIERQVAQQAEAAEQRMQQMMALNDSTQRKLLEMSGRQPSDWILAEADYLVRMASRKLWLEHDLASARQMLKDADLRLAELNDPSLIPLRSLLADDLQTLAMIQDAPIMEMALQAGALARQVDGLELAMVELPEAMDEPEAIKPSGDVADWQQNLKAFWTRTVDIFFKVRHRSEMVKPLMSAQQQWLVKQQLRLHLLEAQFAALREQPELYAQALSQAMALLRENFDGQLALTQQFAAALEQLQGTDISRFYPEKLSVAEPLQRLLAQRVNGEVAND